MGRPVDAVETFVFVGRLALALLTLRNSRDLPQKEQRDAGSQ